VQQVAISATAAVGSQTAFLQQVPVYPTVYALASDFVIAPKPFTGKSGEDPQAWVNYFEVQHVQIFAGVCSAYYYMMAALTG
jgi:hypothetical protein